jgi:hypothetical protein
MGFNQTTKHFTGALPTGRASDHREASIILQDRRGSDVDGGDFSNVGWQTRPLNSIVNDDTGEVSLVSNQFTLPAGSYVIRAFAGAYRVNNHTTRLRNITDSTTTLEGVPNFAPGTSDLHMTASWVVGAFTISAPKTFELQHQGTRTQTGDGFGPSTGFNAESVYASVELLKAL